MQISDVTVKLSPLDDFSSSIAQALFVNSKKQSDLFAATTLANMSQDISETIGEELSPSRTPNVSVIHAGNSLVMLQRSTPAVGATNNDPSGSQISAAKASQNVHKTKVQRPLSNPSISRRPPPPKPQPYSGGGVALFYREIKATKMDPGLCQGIEH